MEDKKEDKNETDSDEFLTENNISDNENIGANNEDLNDLNNEPEFYHNYDDEEEEKITININTTKNDNTINNNNNNIIQEKSMNESSGFNLFKDNTNIEDNLNNNITKNNNNSKLQDDNSTSLNNIFDYKGKNYESFQSNENSNLTNSNIDQKSEILNKSKKSYFFKETNSYTYNESEISLSKSNINKTEEDIKINEDLILNFRKAYPELSEYNISEIYKSLNNEDCFDLTIFELMNIIQRKVSMILTENKYNDKDENYGDKNVYNIPIELLDLTDPDYINNEHLLIMKLYKTMNKDNKNEFFDVKELTEDFLYNDKHDKRKKIVKFLDGSYNYIPEMCPKKECDENDCIYSHNDYEINYHPLFYKTKYKIDSNYCESNMALCPTANNFDEDFRIIYNYKDQNIINLMKILVSECKDNQKRIKKCYNKINNFDLKTFKVFECKKNKCQKDYHLCYKYHKNQNDKRRAPYLYRYSNERCRNMNKECENGEFCNKCHSSNEFNYHKLNFNKTMLCLRNIKNGECEFIDTCYGYHDKNSKNYKKRIIKEELENKILKLKKEKNIDDFKCQKCNKIRINFIFYYLKCKHILCDKCLKKIKNDGICPLCKKPFENGKEFMIDFKESFQNN